jgi:hypothetical protein
MEKQFIRIKYNNMYLSANFAGFTKDKHMALIEPNLLDHKLSLLDSPESAEIEHVEVELKPCIVGTLEFNPDDTYRLGSVNGYIVYQTKKYIWTIQVNEFTSKLVNIEKHKKEHVNTRCLKTGKGYKLI